VPVERLLLVEPRSFCAGVEMAIKALAWMVLLHDEPVYCVHAIVHNDAVVERFERLGVVFVDDIAGVADDAPVVLSAHGSAPAVVELARQRRATVVDSVCPLVAKVHREIRRRVAAGDAIVYVGHHGHDEAVAAHAIAPAKTHVVATPREVEALALETSNISLLAQTTLGIADIDAAERAARTRFKNVWTPRRADLCYATTNRQRALAAACDICDAVVVVGSRTSANTQALVDLARRAGVRAIRVDTPDELPGDLVGSIAVTAGASAPPGAVTDVVAALTPRAGVERFAPIEENEYFPLPRDLRARLGQAVLTRELQAMLDNDRTISAMALLEEIELRLNTEKHASRITTSAPTARR
jgi:4-hydroxy-3-methylbut-2-enyl diphosphate reductase